MLRRVVKPLCMAMFAQGFFVGVASAQRACVTDDRVCNAIYHAVYTNLDKIWVLPLDADRTAALAGESIEYFRVGNYYAVVLMDGGKGPLIVNGWAQVMLFDRSTLRFAGVISRF